MMSCEIMLDGLELYNLLFPEKTCEFVEEINKEHIEFTGSPLLDMIPENELNLQ